MQKEQPHAEWSRLLYDKLRAAGVSIFCYVPDAANDYLIRLATDDEDALEILLTTEEEGVALAAGCHLSGKRAVLLMQSSGVGNCINYFSLIEAARFPFLTVVTMRGDFGEQNPWQYPMGQATEPVLKEMGLTTLKVDAPDDLDVVASSAIGAFTGGLQSVALILGQKFLGAKAI